MTIIKAVYTDETSVPVKAIEDSGKVVFMPSYPSNTHYDTAMDDFIDGGGVIEPWVDTTDYAAVNAQKARDAQVYSTSELTEDDALKAHGLERRIDDPLMVEHEGYITDMQVVEADPPTDPEYEPPIPPGVTVPDDFSFKLTITREEGWQGALGWRAVMTEIASDHQSALASLSLYTAEQCVGFIFTTGAFAGDPPESVCPAGQEPGDEDVHFGCTYSGVAVSCKTLPAGQNSMVWEINT